MTDEGSGGLPGRLDGLLAPPVGLGDGALREWLAMRDRAARRHDHWRRSLPAIEPLFDDEVHRARALAGNLATELGDVLRGTARIAPSAILDGEAAAEWLVASCRSWQVSLRGVEIVGSDDPEAVEFFDAMLAQLVERERDRALEVARDRVAAAAPEPSVLRRFLRIVAVPLRRFFRPS